MSTELSLPAIEIRNVPIVRFGGNALTACAQALQGQGFGRVGLISTPQIDFLSTQMCAALTACEIEPVLFDQIGGEPVIDDIKAAIEMMRAKPIDAIIGLGGGSAMDVAKLVSVLISGDQALAEIVGTDQVTHRSLPLICIPTTAGTGSEASPIAIYEDPEQELKFGVVSPHLIPDQVYLDAQLTVSLPPHVTAATGLDALTHCIEAYTSRFAHPLIDGFAMRGIELIAKNIETACHDGQNLDARGAMLLASHYGGICLGPVNTAAVHALAYPLGGEFHVPHGVANSLLLPHVSRFNMSAAAQRYADVARALGVSDQGSPEQTAQAGIAEIERLSESCGIARKLSDLNIGTNAIPKMAAAAMKVTRLLERNPRPVTEQDAIQIYEAAL